MKKLVKLAVIRKNSEDGCPMGLNIPKFCAIAGEHIDKLAPLNSLGPNSTPEEKQKILAANMRVLTWLLMQDGTELKPCKYVAHLFPKQDGVDCSWNDTAAGEGGGAAFLGYPPYSQLYEGFGLQNIPLGFYSDLNVSRNIFQSLYSLNSGKTKLELIAIANDLLKERAFAQALARAEELHKTALKKE